MWQTQITSYIAVIETDIYTALPSQYLQISSVWQISDRYQRQIKKQSDHETSWLVYRDHQMWNTTKVWFQIFLFGACVTRPEQPKGTKDKVKMPEGQKAGPKGRQLEVRAQRAPRLLVLDNSHFFPKPHFRTGNFRPRKCVNFWPKFASRQNSVNLRSKRKTA